MNIIVLILFVGVFMLYVCEMLLDMSVSFNWKVPGEDKRMVDWVLEEIEKHHGIKKHIQNECFVNLLRDILWIIFSIMVIYVCAKSI